jgi:hypothetical protein
MTQLHEQPPANPTETADVGERDPPIVESPAIFIGPAVDDRPDAPVRGDWVEAGVPMPELLDSIQTVIDSAPDTEPGSWRIRELRGFNDWQPDEQQGLFTVAMVARGIVVHGPAYAALVKLVGADSLAARPDRFRLSFVGEWPSVEAFATTFVEESGWQEQLTKLPTSMRQFVSIDVKKVIRAARRDLSFVGHEAGVWVFDPRVW